MSRIVLLTGSPRRNGNSIRMANAFEEAAARLGHSVDRFDTAQMQVSGCLACDGCYRNGIPCAVDREYNKVASALDKADGLVIATPVYWYTYPAQLKNVMDHWYSLCVAGRDLNGKKAALMACCEDDDITAFDSMVNSFRKSMALLRADIVGEILIQNVHRIGDIDKTDGPERAAKLAGLF